MRASATAGVAVLAVLLASASAFAVAPAPDRQLSPVAFEDTLATGLTGVDVQQAEARGYEIPRAQTFYAQFRYVVGYYGIEAAVAAQRGDATARFGRPLATFVTDYSGTRPRLTEGGFIDLDRDSYLGWTRANDAWFVVGSRARTPGGPAVVPFSDRADASTFAERHGGTVRDWTRLAEHVSHQQPWRAVLENRTEARSAWADRTVATARSHLQRPVSVVVGADAPTLSAAIARAPPNTTVRLPPGTYDGNLTVAKPVTIRGAGSETVVDGDGAPAVLTLAGPGAAVADLAVTGVGDRNVGSLDDGNRTGWDARIRLIYGRGDAGIRLADAHGALVSDVKVETSANGIVALNSSGAVVDGVTVEGTRTWQEGFMDVLPMHSRMVVQDSTLRGGRDGVYTHRADGSVIRDNTMIGMRYGIHEMYTSDLLLANNTIRDTDVGIILMTRPTGNVVLGNDVRASGQGLSTAGGATVVARNVLADNDLGLSIATSRSGYLRNTVVDNGVGIRDDTLLPSNDVFGNDVVGNAEFVDTGLGVTQVWTSDSRGNYWGDVPGRDRDGDGVVDRTFHATGAVDSVAAAGASGPRLLATSPAVSAGRAFQEAVPGLRPAGVLDTAPLATPVRPGVLARLNGTAAGPGGGDG